MIKKAQRDTGQTIRAYVNHLNNTLQSDLTMAFRNFTQSLLVKEPGICELRQTYAQMDAVRVAEEVFTKWTTVYREITYQDYLHASKAAKRVRLALVHQ